MQDLVQIKRALISVSDKADLVPFAQALRARGVTIISTGGTAKALSAAGIEVVHVEQVTNFPEGLDGRVKTLHPAVHGGLLAIRGNIEHEAFLRKHGIQPIDLVCINLYPFQQTVADPAVTLEHAIENIDVGGPAMLRAAAKNFDSVTVVTSPAHYDRIATELQAHNGCTTRATRAELAASAFARTSEYDSAIAAYLGRRQEVGFPSVLRLGFTKVDDLRYGENPQQEAALYRDPASTGPSVVNARQLHGKQLSYNNINDAANALEAARALRKLALGTPGLPSGLVASFAAVVVKHTNPCGGAAAQTGADAVRAAIAGDPVAAYGGILAVSQNLDAPTARIIADEKNFLEVIVAPTFDDDALDILRSRWANVRLLAVGDRASRASRKLEYRSVPGGLLAQDRDMRASDPSTWEHRTGPAPTREQLAAAAVLDTLCKHISSNAVVVGGIEVGNGGGGGVRLFGVGSGQVDRVSACRLAVEKAGANAKGAIAVGDAFFPFSDGPKVLIDAGVRMIVQPGGSKRDQDTFDLCQTRGVTCLTTSVRHFRH